MTRSEPRWNFLPIEKGYQRESFDCGYRVLNEYLKKYARQNHQKGIAKTFIALPAGSIPTLQIAHRLEVWGYTNFRPPARINTSSLL